MKYYLGIDQGTTGTTALVFNEEWSVCGKGYSEHKQYYPKPGWVEHNPSEIWNNLKRTVVAALNHAKIQAKDLRAVGLDNQGETCMIWDKNTGEPLYNAIVWQDRRTAKAADALREKYEPVIRQKTGLKVDAYFSALKIKWLLDNVKNVRNKIKKGELAATTLDTWLLWKMTENRIYATDSSTASRTMLYNIYTNQWDDELCSLVGIPKTILPEIEDSAHIYGFSSKEFLANRVPVSGNLVDQSAALFGQACFDKGTVKTTYGTGCFMLLNTGDEAVESKNGLITTVAWRLNEKITYALDGGVYIAGAAVQWLRDGLKIIRNADETEALARSVPDSGGVYFVPAFAGLAAPYWDQYARGLMIGLTGGTTRAHIVRATLEAIAFQVAENLEVMQKDSGTVIKMMRADGGAAVNEFLMQFQADILGMPVEVPEINEAAALGAACFAALGIADIKAPEEINNNWKLKKRYLPSMDEDKRRSLMEQWKKAVQRSLKWRE